MSLKHKIIKTTIAFLIGLGTILGEVFGFFPAFFKKAVIVLSGRIIALVPDKIYIPVYLFCNEIIKRMYFAKEGAVFLVKNYKNFKIDLDVSKKTGRAIYLQRVYEPYIFNYLAENLKEGDWFVDVGANVGIFTLLASTIVGPQGRVFAFEPEKNNFANLIKNIKLNKLTNIVCANRAIGTKEGSGILYINPLNDGGGSLWRPVSFSDDEKKMDHAKIRSYFPHVELRQDVGTISLDDFFKDYAMPKSFIIKIDVEGAEADVLSGANKILDTYDAEIIPEISRDEEKIFGLLNAKDYGAYELDDLGNLSERRLMRPREGKNILFKK